MLASDILVRPAVLHDAPALAIIQVDMWRTTYDGIIAREYLDQLSYEEKEAQWIQGLEAASPRFCRLVAVIDGTVVGFVVLSILEQPDRGATSEMHSLYVTINSQGNGIGAALFTSGVEWLKARGERSMLIRVLKGNTSACGFYESRGAKLIGEEMLSIGGVEYPQLLYCLALT